MFKNLKKKFILVYTFSIFLILLFSFSIIFTISFNNFLKEVNIRLEIKPENRPKKSPDNVNSIPYKEILNQDILIIDNQVYSSYELSSEQLNQINIAVDKKQRLIKINSDVYMLNSNHDTIKLVRITQNINSLLILLISLILILFLITFFSAFLGLFLARKALKPIIENYENQKRFVSDASHELKTPLQILNNSLLLLKNDDDEKEKWLDYSLKETQRLTKLTTNLLTLSKDQNIEVTQTINVSDTINFFISVIETSLFENNFNFNYHIEDNINFGILEEDLTQVLHNLIENARKYNDHRQEIKIDLFRSKKGAVLEISNTANYIANNHLDNLFERFYKIDTTRNTQGNSFGLGLSIVKTILDKYQLKYKIKYQDSYFIFKIKFDKIT